MASGILSPTSKLVSELSVSQGEAFLEKRLKYTWHNARVVTYLAYKICRDLILDMKSMVEKFDQDYEDGKVGPNWFNFSHRTAGRTFEFILNESAITEDETLGIGGITRQMQYKDFNGMVQFLDEVYGEHFENVEISEKIRLFLEDEIDGVGKKTATFSSGMKNLTLLRKIVNTRLGLEVEENHGFNGLGDVFTFDMDYITNADIELRASINVSYQKLERKYIAIINDVCDHIKSIMSSASRLVVYYKLYEQTGNKDNMYNPPLVIFRDYRRRFHGRPTKDLDKSVSCILGLIQLDRVFYHYERKRAERRMSMIRSRRCMRKQTMPDLRGTCM